MSEQLTLSAETRELAGKGASRALRREGRVPAVVYGNNEAPLSIHLEEKVLMKMLHTGHFMNSVVMIDAGGQTTRTLPKDVQFHAVTDRPVHVDFLRISEHAQVTVAVPINFINELKSPGIKRGGVLNAVRHELELVCDAAEIPNDVIVDLAGTDIGDSIHISQVTLPKGTTSAITDRDFTIATIVAPSGVKSEAAEAAAAAEGGEEEPGADEVPTVGEAETEEGGE
ncbi:50S ribosomal protein L25/general stress protein Ctc [Sphingosinicella sp.]|uniref:50S ribosomal protein L25/general stress protein Ctc n=1 Tax=Sphingosinicella sp. TaxID=1917971 RepID=UPI004037E27B